MTMKSDKWVTRYDDLSGTFQLFFHGNVRCLRTITVWNIEQMNKVITMAVEGTLETDEEIRAKGNQAPATFEDLESALARGVTIQRIPAVDKKSKKLNIKLEDIGL